MDALIDSSYKKLYDTPDSINGIKIKESAADARLREVTIRGLISKTIVIKLDAGKQICLCFKKSQKDVHKGCDAIIITTIDNQGFIFICEMKSKKPKPKDYVAQIKNSNIFIDYTASILNVFFQKDIKSFKKQNILFYRTRSPKKESKKKRYESENQDGIRIVKVPNPTFVNINDFII